VKGLHNFEDKAIDCVKLFSCWIVKHLPTILYSQRVL